MRLVHSAGRQVLIFLCYLTLAGSTLASPACPVELSLDFKVDTYNIYSDKNNSIPDPNNYIEYQRRVAASRSFIVALEKIIDSNDIIQLKSCALPRINILTVSGPNLSGKDHIHRAYEFNRVVFSLGMAVIKLESLCPDCDTRTFWAWAQSNTRVAIQMFHERHIRLNNLYFWLAATAAMSSNGQKDLIGFASATHRQALARVDENGRVATESERGQMSNIYSAFAIEAMTFTHIFLNEDMNGKAGHTLQRGIAQSIDDYCQGDKISDKKPIPFQSISWTYIFDVIHPNVIPFGCLSDKKTQLSRANYFLLGGKVSEAARALRKRRYRMN